MNNLYAMLSPVRNFFARVLHLSKEPVILSPPPGWSSWEEIMQEAIKEAEYASKIDEVPVGAVVLDKEGKIIGRGYNCSISTCNPTGHAEIMALQNAGAYLKNYRLIDCYLVVTLEPCIMCAGAMIHARIKGMVYGASDKKTGAVDSKMQTINLPFHNHHFAWLGGIKKIECANLLSVFFKNKRLLARISKNNTPLIQNE